MAEELRPQLREEALPDGAVVVIRGGPVTSAKLREHALRTRRAYVLDGRPLLGVSVFCALDPSGEASLDGLLAGRLVSYPVVHLPTATAVLEAGFELLPSFGRPHYTLRLTSDEDPELDRLMAALGPQHSNPYHVRTRRRGGNWP